MDKKPTHWKLGNEGMNDESAFISRSRFLSGYDGQDLLKENIPYDLFASVSNANRSKKRANLTAIFLSTVFTGGIVLFALKAVVQASIDPLFGSALCFLGVMVTARYQLNKQASVFEFSNNEVENPSPNTPKATKRIYYRANHLKDLNVLPYTKQNNQKFYLVESFDWNMPNAYVFILGDDSHRASLGLDGHLAGELFFKKSEILPILGEEKRLFEERALKQKRREAKLIKDAEVALKNERNASQLKSKREEERLSIEKSRHVLERERHQLEHQKERLALAEREEALNNRKATRLREAAKQQEKKTKRNRERHCPRMLLVCYKKKYLNAFIALNLERGTLSAQEKIYYDFLVFIHKNWTSWKPYRDGDRESAEGKAFETLLEIPLNVMGDKNITRLHNINGMNWRYLEDWLEDLNFILDENLPQKGELLKTSI